MAIGRLGAGFGRMGTVGTVTAAAVVATTTWNSADKSASITLSNGDLTWTSTSAATYANVRSVASASSGKKYWEMTMTAAVTAANSIVEGIANASQVLTGQFLGGTNNSVGWAGDGTVYLTGGSIATIATWDDGNVLCFAFDITATLIWFRVNGGNWNNSGAANPATGAGGIDVSGLAAGPYFAAGSGFSNGDIGVANFGATAYAQAVPSGFGNW